MIKYRGIIAHAITVPTIPKRIIYMKSALFFPNVFASKPNIHLTSKNNDMTCPTENFPVKNIDKIVLPN